MLLNRNWKKQVGLSPWSAKSNSTSLGIDPQVQEAEITWIGGRGVGRRLPRRRGRLGKPGNLPVCSCSFRSGSRMNQSEKSRIPHDRTSQRFPSGCCCRICANDFVASTGDVHGNYRVLLRYRLELVLPGPKAPLENVVIHGHFWNPPAHRSRA